MIRSIILVAVVSFLTLPSVAQNTELEKRKGFKDIKIEMPVDSVKGVKFKKDFKERDEFPAKLYTVENPDYGKIGEVGVKSIELKAYKGLIYEIAVITEKDTRLIKALESIYGKADYDAKNVVYLWKADSLILRFKTHSKNELELTYSSFALFKRMKEDKDKKIDDIADDL
jgi:hypothetical protein